ncbi:response regulator [Sandaracinus amylolyticus]|uniref:response regulator n=1 Tax=Sandaracinus amylolyticus TaxID=927083 RepID=UPI001F392CE3|nr:response regulator [Sandaracinus amylolyticus]UJR85812.1 Hypothetical protein I5071_78920 [Sandaracinus amylolyticus]
MSGGSRARSGRASDIDGLAPTAGGSAGRARRARRASGMRISEPRSVVVVEDDADLRAIYREMLERDGWEVRLFDRPGDALQSIHARLPHVVLTDVNLNGQSGRELARALRSDERTAGLAIVAASGSVIPTTPMLRMFDTFLRKPVDVTTLGAVLRDIVDRRFAD